MACLRQTITIGWSPRRLQDTPPMVSMQQAPRIPKIPLTSSGYSPLGALNYSTTGRNCVHKLLGELVVFKRLYVKYLYYTYHPKIV